MRSTQSTAMVGIDLGTANTRAVSSRTGIVFDQPSICCFQGYDAVPRFITAGDEASNYEGRVARPLKIVHPLRNGVLSDMTAARDYLRFVRRSLGGRRRFGRIKPFIGIPADATQSEQRALKTAAVDAGFGMPRLIPEPYLAALGLGLDLEQPSARMIVECGAGTTEIAVIALGGFCLVSSVRGGGNALNKALSERLHSRHQFQIGAIEAEKLKLQLSEIYAGQLVDTSVSIKGLDIVTGLPRVRTLPVAGLHSVWTKHIMQIVEGIRAQLHEAPPEIAQDILENGITLTGGGSLVAQLAEEISQHTQVRTYVAEHPKDCVALGLRRLLSGEVRAPEFH